MNKNWGRKPKKNMKGMKRKTKEKKCVREKGKRKDVTKNYMKIE